MMMVYCLVRVPVRVGRAMVGPCDLLLWIALATPALYMVCDGADKRQEQGVQRAKNPDGGAVPKFDPPVRRFEFPDLTRLYRISSDGTLAALQAPDRRLELFLFDFRTGKRVEDVGPKAADAY